MACKNSRPQEHCGECFYINHDAYRGVGKKVCYELRIVDEQKAAVEVSENQKSCDKFRNVKKVGRAG